MISKPKPIDDFVFIEIEIFSYCNRKCWFCPNSFVDRRGENLIMPEKKYLSILQQLKDMNFEGEIAYSRYNEPLSHKDIFIKRLQQAREYLPKAKLRTNSNGDYVTKEYIIDLYKAGLNELFIQQYLKNNEIYNHSRVKKEIKRKLDKVGLPYKLLYDYENRKIEYDLSYKDMTVHIRGRNFTYDGSSRGETVPLAVDYVRTERCLKPFTSMYIDYNGSVMICCNLRSDIKQHDIGYMGNAFETPIKQIWNGDRYLSWRKHHEFNGPKEGACRSCKIGL